MALRSISFGFLACATAGLGACATRVDPDEQALALAGHYEMCLSPQRPAHSPEFTDCVLARYEKAQQQGRRLEGGLNPAPPPPSAVPTVASAVAPTATPTATPVWQGPDLDHGGGADWQGPDLDAHGRSPVWHGSDLDDGRWPRSAEDFR